MLYMLSLQAVTCKLETRKDLRKQVKNFSRVIKAFTPEPRHTMSHAKCKREGNGKRRESKVATLPQTRKATGACTDRQM